MLFPPREQEYPGSWTEGIVRIGQVSSVNTAAATARVLCDDRDALVSMELPVLQLGTAGVQSYLLPAPGERVLCLFLGSGVEQGFIVGSFYDDDNPPPVSGEVIYLRVASDCFVLVNKSTKEVIVSTSGKVSITAADGVYIIGDVDITGEVTVSGDVVAGGISLVNHIHYDPGDSTFVDPPFVG
jgi:phage baseplate assembly protein gpV